MNRIHPDQTSWFDASEYDVKEPPVSKKDFIEYIQEFDSGYKVTLRWSMGLYDILVQDPDGKTMNSDWVVGGNVNALSGFKIACDLVSSFGDGDRDFDAKPWADLTWVNGVLVHED